MITLYDTTLRDGSQSEGINFTVRDKLRITQLLDEFGLPMIEGGWPGSNPKDVEYFRQVRELKLKQTRVTAFGATCRPKSSPAEDPNIVALIEAETPVVTVVGKSWTRHVTQVLQTDLDNNLRIIEQSLAHLAAAGREVIFDAEHFFDGYATDADYAMATLTAAVAGGAGTLVLCDTNGGMLPWQVAETVEAVRAQIDTPLGIHAHNDSGCAVANSLAAVHAGCTHVQGTINGFGERCGNADMCALAANLELKLGQKVLPDGRLAGITELSRRVSEMVNVPHPRNAPYVGRSAFAHKGGIHVAAIQRDDGSYEHVDPETVGNARRVLVSELSGKGSMRMKLVDFGLDDSDKHVLKTVLERIKELENRGFAFEAAEASVELMIRRERPDWRPFFELMDFMVVVEHREGRGLLAEANTKLRIGGDVYHTAADGVGPVDALDHALRKALMEVYPGVQNFRLTDYTVRILDAHLATEAVTRVLVETTDGHDTWTTVGASQNIIEASWQAVKDSIDFGLMRSGVEAPVASAVEGPAASAVEAPTEGESGN